MNRRNMLGLTGSLMAATMLPTTSQGAGKVDANLERLGITLPEPSNPVASVKGRCPRPLDDGGTSV